MKLVLVVAFFFAAVSAGPLDNTYLPPNSANLPHQPSPSYGPANSNSGFRNLGPDAHSNILRFDNDNDGTGNYQFQYETENKISQQEHGQLKHVGQEEVTVVQGSYSYIGDDGRTYVVNYIADENGFQPSGEHIDQAISKTAAEAARLAVPDYQQGPAHGQNAQGGYRY